MFQFIFGLLQGGVVLGPGNIFVGLLLGHLAHEIVVVGFLVEIVFHLVLRIEFHKHIAVLHGRSGRSQLGDDHGTDLRPFEPGSKDRERVGSHGGSIQAECVRELLFLNAIDRFSAVDRRLCPAEMGEKEGNENANQQRKCAEEEDLRLTAKNRMSAHNLNHPWTSGGLVPQGSWNSRPGKWLFRETSCQNASATHSPGVSHFTAYSRPGISIEYPKTASPRPAGSLY